MAVIKIESKDKIIIAHDTLITFGNELLEITFNDNPEENKITTSTSSFVDLKMEINFSEDENPSEIKVSDKNGVLVVTVNNAKKASSIIGGLSDPIKIGSKGDNKDYYLNFVFSRVGNSYWLTYMIYLVK